MPRYVPGMCFLKKKQSTARHQYKYVGVASLGFSGTFVREDIAATADAIIIESLRATDRHYVWHWYLLAYHPGSGVNETACCG